MKKGGKGKESAGKKSSTTSEQATPTKNTKISLNFNDLSNEGEEVDQIPKP
jgi:hypothetical protein